jgi:hypothetical protein
MKNRNVEILRSAALCAIPRSLLAASGRDQSAAAAALHGGLLVFRRDHLLFAATGAYAHERSLSPRRSRRQIDDHDDLPPLEPSLKSTAILRRFRRRAHSGARLPVGGEDTTATKAGPFVPQGRRRPALQRGGRLCKGGGMNDTQTKAVASDPAERDRVASGKCGGNLCGSSSWELISAGRKWPEAW